MKLWLPKLWLKQICRTQYFPIKYPKGAGQTTMIKSFYELEEERDILLDAIEKCDPNDEVHMQELQDQLDLVEQELDLNPDEY